MPKEEKYPWEEEDEETEECEEYEEPSFGDPESNPLLLMHCKPVYNFQSIEFDIEINPNNPDDIDRMFGIYSAILTRLQGISVDQPKPIYMAPKEPLASEKQKEIMDRYNIPYTNKTTQKQATKLISDSMKG